jgi:hypothetical protein
LATGRDCRELRRACDENGLVWIGVHFGSRGLGHTSATRYLKLAGGKDGMNVPPALIDEDSELGRRYIAAMQLAGRYAYAGREWVTDRVRQSSAVPSPTPCTTTTTTLGEKRTTVVIYGWCARVLRRPSLVSEVSSEDQWATTP